MFCGCIDFGGADCAGAAAAMLGAAPGLVTMSAPGADFGVLRMSGSTERFRREAIIRDDEAGLIAIGDVRLDDRAGLGATLDAAPDAHDLALVLAAYRRWGEGCAERLYGDFAFAVVDLRTRRVFAARDHIGVRPLYYWRRNGRLAFAGALRAVTQAPGAPTAFDDGALRAFLSHARPLRADETLLADIRRLPAGTRMQAGAEGLATARWWRPEATPALRLGSDADYAAALQGHIRRAVAACLPDAGLVGAHLSGGLDCSTIATIAAEYLRAEGRPAPLCFAWQAPPQKNDDDGEYRRIESVRSAADLDLRYIAPDTATIRTLFEIDPARQALDVNLIHEIPVQNAAAAAGIQVMLSGFGGDEFASFRGAGHAEALLMRGAFGAFAAEARALGRSPYGYALSIAGRSLADAVRDAGDVALSLGRRRPPRYGRPTSVRNGLMSALRYGHLESRIEGWADRGEALGLVYRYPLLDRALIEFVFALPPEQFRRQGVTRRIMRAAVRGVLPDSVIDDASKREDARVKQMLIALNDAFAVPPAAPTPAPDRAGYVDRAQLEALMQALGRRKTVGALGLGIALRRFGFLNGR